MRTSITISLTILIAALPVSVSVFSQEADKEQQVAAFKQAVQQSMARLRKYEWVETTTVSLKAEVKSQKHNRCYYGADGQVQKISIDESAAEQAAPSGGRLKRRIVAKKKEEMTDYMKAAVELVHKYVPPNPELIKYSKEVGNVTVQPVPSSSFLRVSFRDFLKLGDVLSSTLNLQPNSIVDINVSTYLESQKDAVDVAIRFDNLADGTNFASQIVLDAKSKNLQVVVTNGGHRPLGN